MTAVPYNPFVTYVDGNGAPLSGGKIFTYQAGTTTPQASYVDALGITQASNPIILDSNGRSPYGAIWGAGVYKFVLQDVNGVQIGNPIDNVSATYGAGDMTKAVYDAANISQQVVGTTAVQTVSNKVFDSSNTFPGAGVVFSQIAGYLPSSIAGTNTTATISISAGQAADSTNVSYITKNTPTSWAVNLGNVANGYQGGATLPNSSTIHMFMMSGTSGTASFASLSLTPTLPSGYTIYRRVFSFNTTAAGAPIQYTAIEAEGGAIKNWLTTQTMDVPGTSITTTRALLTLNVPIGFKVEAEVRHSTTSNSFYLLTSGDETDVAPATVVTTAPQMSGTANYSANTAMTPTIDLLTTTTSGQIGARANAALPLYLVTRGWKDFRRA